MALREVNLITADLLERRLLRRHLVLWAGVLALLIILVAAVHLRQVRAVAAASLLTPGGTGAGALLAARADEVQRAQAERDLLRLERQELGAAVASRRPYSSVLAALADRMDGGTWLQQLTVETLPDRTAHLVLMGSARSQGAVGALLERLSGDPLFRGVILKYAQESRDRLSGGAPVLFQIECDVGRGA